MSICRIDVLSRASLFNFEDEVIIIMKTVSFAFNDFDFVVRAFDAAVVDLEAAVGKDAAAVRVKHAGEVNERFDAAISGHCKPFVEVTFCDNGIGEVPQGENRGK